MELRKALDIRPGELVSLVGGGGKTTIMFALARELALAELPVVTTTTTNILEPSPSETPLLFLSREDDKIVEFLRNLDAPTHVTVASEQSPSGKLRGLSPDSITRFARLNPRFHFIVEADGAAGKPVKAPAAWEPVIPPTTSLVIPIVGIDGLGCRLTAENVFRAEIVSRLTGLAVGERVSANAIAMLVTHPEGIAKGSPPDARVIPFINKIRSAEDLLQGRALAARIIRMGHPRVECVGLGQAKSPDPVLEVVWAAGAVGRRNDQW